MDEQRLMDYVRLVSNKRVLEVSADFLIDGKLTKSQFMRTFQAPRHVVDKLFELYDDDGNGVLDHKEFLMAMQDLDNGHAHSTCDICKELMWKWYECDECLEAFQICTSCYCQKQHNHPHEFHFVKNYKEKECGDLPKQTGLFLGKEINALMQEYDFDNSGTISVQEFLSIVPYSVQSARKVIQSIFGQNDGELSKTKFLQVMCILEASRACSECKQDFELDNRQALACANANCDYYVCRNCLHDGRCRHSCPFFECAGPFRLCDIGMGLNSEGKLKVIDSEVWDKWKPFYEAYLNRNYASLIYKNPSQNLKGRRVMTLEEQSLLATEFENGAKLFDFQKFIHAQT